MHVDSELIRPPSAVNVPPLLIRGGRLMVDFGFTSPMRLNSLNRSLKEITHVAVSHIHADHVGGLEELAFMSRFVFRRRPTLLLPDGLADDLWLTALRGGLEWTADDKGDPEQCTLETYYNVMRINATKRSLSRKKVLASFQRMARIAFIPPRPPRPFGCRRPPASLGSPPPVRRRSRAPGRATPHVDPGVNPDAGGRERVPALCAAPRAQPGPLGSAPSGQGQGG